MLLGVPVQCAPPWQRHLVDHRDRAVDDPYDGRPVGLLWVELRRDVGERLPASIVTLMPTRLSELCTAVAMFLPLVVVVVARCVENPLGFPHFCR